MGTWAYGAARPAFGWAGMRRVAAAGLMGFWAVLVLARLPGLGEPPVPRPGEAAAAFYPAAAALLPTDARYLHLDGVVYGGDPSVGPRLRYELAPRAYDAVRADLGLEQTLARLDATGRDYVLVPRLGIYPRPHWLTSRRGEARYDRLVAAYGLILARRPPNTAAPK